MHQRINGVAALLVACLAATVSSIAAAQEPANLALAQRLVTKAQLDELAMLGLRLAGRRGVADGKAPQAFADCLAARDAGVFSNPIATVYAKHLSPAELNEALRFFDSTAGQKYVVLAMRNTEQTAGFAPMTPPPSITDKETKEILAFSISSAGQQLSGASPELAKATSRAWEPVIDAILNGCRDAR